jgi:hypothetical protein
MAILAEHHAVLEKYDLAEPLYKRALSLPKRVNGPTACETAQLMRGVATLHRDTGRSDEVEAIYRQALAALERIKGREYNQYCGLAPRAKARPLLHQSWSIGWRPHAALPPRPSLSRRRRDDVRRGGRRPATFSVGPQPTKPSPPVGWQRTL